MQTHQSPHGRRRRADRQLLPTNNDPDFPVVAVGASAGGLDAFRALLDALPADTGMAFILAQHLDPIHVGTMAELLSQHTVMSVVELEEGLSLQPNHIYVFPPDRNLVLNDRVLQLFRREDHQGAGSSFDHLLKSIAEAFGSNVVCIILSGAGEDGTVGAQAVKDLGGLVICQDPDEAEYDRMPRRVIATGAADLVLRLAKMPEALAEHHGDRYPKLASTDTASPMGGGLGQIIDLLSKKTSNNFALYKDATVARRIGQRMAVAGIEDSSRYFELLNKDPEEVHRLVGDLLMNVTRFFRDTEAFEEMSKTIIPALVEVQPIDRPIRVWVAGCSTGEEAYSIAMLLLEAIAVSKRPLRLQIFASDVDANVIGIARQGRYRPSIEFDVPPARLARFFDRDDRGYRVGRELRKAVVFSVHSLLADPPFLHLDLITCRNLLVDFLPDIQRKVLALFHFSLRPDGVLFLGPAESVNGADDHFKPICEKLRIYRHNGCARPGDASLPFALGSAIHSLRPRLPPPLPVPQAGIGDFVQRLLLREFAPASVLVNEKRVALYYFGPTDLYLKMPAGEATRDLLASAQEELRPAIRAALAELKRTPEKVIAIAGKMSRDGGSVGVTISARPAQHDGEDLVLLTFVDEPEQEQTSSPVIESAIDAPRIAQIKQELEAVREDLEDAIRSRESAEEQVRAVGEEAMSVSEEFQATNEELETTKEELQSFIEELQALNTQLQEALGLQQSLANDLGNILNRTDVATLLLDGALKIRFLTPATKALFSVIASDIGRPLADFAHQFTNENILLADAEAVLVNLTPVAREIETLNGGWYDCRVQPYWTPDNHVGGVIITFVDVTVRKRSEDALVDAKLQAERVSLGKSRFLAAAIHDLRQRLQTLTFLHGLLARNLTDQRALQLVTRSENTLTVMSGILNALLDIDLLEAGVICPEPVDFPIVNLLDRLQSEFASHIKGRGLGWNVVHCRWAVHSDPRLLEKLLRCLLSNAVKYTARGKVLLGCRRRGDTVRIEVWDTGSGIPVDELRTILGEFHQIDNPGHDRRRGLDLHLSIVQQMAKILGHTVNVRSQHGRGSMFAVEVPLVPDGKSLPHPVPALITADIAARSGSILLVEDDQELRYSLDMLLRADGHSTVASGDGEEAIGLIARNHLRPDLIIVDNNLQVEATGLRVMPRLRELLGHDLPALILTGDTSGTMLSRVAGRNDVYRDKPIGATELTHLVRALLADGRPAGAPSRRLQRTVAMESAHHPTIFVVDDDGAVRDSLRELIEKAGWPVEVYGSAKEFLSSNPAGRSGCLVVDCRLPDMDGFALLEHLRATRRPLPTVMIASFGDVLLAARAMKAGAASFIEKPVRGDELFAAVDRALNDARVPVQLDDRRRTAGRGIDALTPRERQVLDLVVEGQSNKEIAFLLEISQRTIETHRASMMKKVGARSLSQLIHLTLQAGG